MTYKVTHYERYLPEPSIVEYETIEDIKSRYQLYSETIDFNVGDLEYGDAIEFTYDNYIDLIVERY